MSNNIPKLRFVEFSEKWEPYTLKQLCQKPMYGLNTPSTVYDGKNGYIRITDIDDTSRKFVKENITSPLEFSDDYLLSEGDILFARTGASVGKSYKYQPCDGKLYFAGFLIKFSVAKASAPFVFYQTLRSEYNKWVKIMSMRSGQPGINAEEYGGYQSLYPKQDEQKKIADFLSAVDSRIEGLEMMMDLQKRYKQGVMQRLFNQTIRFKDSNGNPFPDWQEIRLDKAFKLQGGFAFKSEEFTDLGIPIIRISNIPIIGDNIDLSDCIYYEEIPNELNFIVNNGDLVIAMSGATTGKTAIYRYPNKAYLNQRVGLFKLVDNNNHYPFIYHLVKSTSFMTQLKSTLVAGAQPNISSKDIESFIVNLPEKEEQKKIADFLSVLDSKIEAIQKQLDAAREWEKGLLQKMFV